MSTRLAPAFCLHDARPILRAAQDLQLRTWGRRAVLPEFRYAAGEQARADLAGDLDHAFDADGISNLERAQIPSESPSHHSIDVVGGVGDRRRDLR